MHIIHPPFNIIRIWNIIEFAIGSKIKILNVIKWNKYMIQRTELFKDVFLLWCNFKFETSFKLNKAITFQQFLLKLTLLKKGTSVHYPKTTTKLFAKFFKFLLWSRKSYILRKKYHKVYLLIWCNDVCMGMCPLVQALNM